MMILRKKKGIIIYAEQSSNKAIHLTRNVDATVWVYFLHQMAIYVQSAKNRAGDRQPLDFLRDNMTKPLTDEEFKKLRQDIKATRRELAKLQEIHRRETGRHYHG